MVVLYGNTSKYEESEGSSSHLHFSFLRRDFATFRDFSATLDLTDGQQKAEKSAGPLFHIARTTMPNFVSQLSKTMVQKNNCVKNIFHTTFRTTSNFGQK